MGWTKLIRGYLVSYEKCQIFSDNNFLEMKCFQNVSIVQRWSSFEREKKVH